MLHHGSLCMIISYAWHLACHLHLDPAYGRISLLSWMLVWVFGLVKNGSSLGFDIHSRHFVTFEFCQRGATVDIPFLTVLKTWTSSFEHSMIINARVRFEFSEVSATCLASRSPNLSVLCLVVNQTLVFLLLMEEGALFAMPSTHRPRLEATGPVFLPSAKCVGRSALFLVGRPLCWSIDHFCWPYPVHMLCADIFVPAGIHN